MSCQKPINSPLQLLAIFLIAALSGCRVAEETAKLPMRAVGAITPSSTPPPDSALMQSELQRFADEYISRTLATLEEYGQLLNTEEARTQALKWKVTASTVAINIVSGANPQVNLIDFITLITVTRKSLEEYWTKTPHGESFQRWLDTSKALEQNAWKLAKTSLTAEQQKELQDSIQRWWDSNPELHKNFFLRPQEFSLQARKTSEDSGSGSIFGLIGLDPTAGLDPAVREVTRTRLFAERAMFMAQRLPFLLRGHIELMADEMLHKGQVVQALNSIERISHAAESLSETAAQLPKTLEIQSGKLQELSKDITKTLEAGERMSNSLNTTINTAKAFIEGLDQRKNAKEASGQQSPSRPFDILDYAKTAEQTTAMLKELNQAMEKLNQTLSSTAAKQITDHTTENVRGLIYQAFWLTGGLIVLCFVCALIYRRIKTSIK